MKQNIDSAGKQLIFSLTDAELDDLLALSVPSLNKMEAFIQNFIANEMAERRQQIVDVITKKLASAQVTDLIEIKRIIDK